MQQTFSMKVMLPKIHWLLLLFKSRLGVKLLPDVDVDIGAGVEHKPQVNLQYLEFSCLRFWHFPFSFCFLHVFKRHQTGG